MDKKQDVRTFPWLAEGEEAAGKDAAEITINYADGAYNTFKYDADSKLYTKYVRDEPLIDANNSKEITCANILVQEVPFKMYDSQSQRLDIDPTAGGKATMFTQGKVVEGTWERKDLDSPTIFKDADGKEFKMTPGVTWIQMIDSTVKFEYSEQRSARIGSSVKELRIPGASSARYLVFGKRVWAKPGSSVDCFLRYA